MTKLKQAQHTPGPWIVYKGPMNMDGGLNPFFRGIVALLKNSGEGEEIAVILDRNENAHDYEANARLIAAAPELLEALTWIIAEVEVLEQNTVKHSLLKPTFRAWLEKANPAIAKATGAQELTSSVGPDPRDSSLIDEAIASQEANQERFQ